MALSETESVSGGRWTLFTNHAVVLFIIARNPDCRMQDIAQEVGITLRATQMIIADLAQAGYIDRERVGRRNHYVIHPDQPVRHPSLKRRLTLAALLSLTATSFADSVLSNLP